MFMKSLAVLTMFALSLTNAIAASSSYRTLEIQQFEVPGDIGLPPDFSGNLMADLVAEISRSKAFSHVYRAGTNLEGAAPPALRLTGRITEFRRGNRAVRYMVGFGAGKTVLKADIQFVDVETGKVIMQRTVDGKVVMGLLGGEAMGATRGVAKEVAKLARQSIR